MMVRTLAGPLRLAIMDVSKATELEPAPNRNLKTMSVSDFRNQSFACSSHGCADDQVDLVQCHARVAHITEWIRLATHAAHQL
eukprot:4651471-Amphidinium_carterae.2